MVHDPERVSWALQTAQAKWSAGDPQEALRWLQRAATTARELGLTERCEQLRHAASLLEESSPSQAATTRMSPSVDGNGAETLSHVPALRLDQTRVSLDQTRVSPGQARVSAGQTPRIQVAQAANAHGHPAPSHMSRTTPSAGVEGTQPAAGTTGGPSSLMWDSQATPTQISGPAATRQALRVCVAQATDGSLQVVLLSEGEPPRPGMREALLVALGSEPLLP